MLPRGCLYTTKIELFHGISISLGTDPPSKPQPIIVFCPPSPCQGTEKLNKSDKKPGRQKAQIIPTCLIC